MTPDERALLVAVAWAVEKMATISGDQNMVATIHAAVQRYGATPIPVPLTPRPKYVSIEHAPDPGQAAARWKYARTQKDVWIDSPRDGDKHAALLAVGENITHADVAAVLGASWAYLSCDGCDETELVRAVSIHGQYDSGHKYCQTCIREAASLLDIME